ncbi:hypothetical protein CMI47_22140 [Candidatus Pacearchaeota archaeon]|nr:hypothetical protein [Candidatus Pacearchaeota archaeon]|tara:strand:- start:28020 stop:30488 length:2469 start_codon:yes stop_codon:yes gene_type:complete
MFNFKKLGSVLASAAMIGSTAGLAAAANYPAPFVSGGAADIAVVYGSTAAATDLVAVADITANLQAKLAAQTATGGTTSGTSVSGGDFVKLSKTSDNINLGNEVASVFGTSIDDDDLPNLLADAVYRNDENTEFDYEQKITLPPNFVLSHFTDNNFNNEEPTVGINISSSTNVFLYTLNFINNAESDVVSGDLADIETTDITMLGRNYFIFDVDNSTSKITLLDSANSGIVTQGETITIDTEEGLEYDVSISFISGTAVKLVVNGETTNSLVKGATYRLTDDSYVGIKEINKLEVSGEVGTVEFSIGSGKLELPNGNNIELNDDAVQEITSYIRRGSTSGGKETIDKIELNWTTDSDSFIAPLTDDGLGELLMPGFEVVKFSMGEFYTPAAEVVTVKPDGTTSIDLTLTLKDGEVTVPIIYSDSNGYFVGIGEDANDLLVTSGLRTSVVFNETKGDEWLVASWNSTSEAEGYLLDFTSWKKESGINKTTVRKLTPGTPQWVNVCADRIPGDTCDIGSLTLTINNVRYQGNEKSVNVSSTQTGASFNKLYTAEGLRVNLPYLAAANTTAHGAINFTMGANGHAYNVSNLHHNNQSWGLYFVEENKDDSIDAGNVFNITLNDNSDKEIQVNSIDTRSKNEKEVEDNNNLVSRVKGDLATKVRRIGASSDQRWAEVTYSGSESYGDIFLTVEGATLTDTDGSDGTVTELGSVAVSDGEVDSVSGKNLVVVGGSCVNSVAADLVGGDYCGEGWETATGVGSGSFLIETFERTGGKVATLVAGYNAGDTTNAAKALTTQTIDTAAGTKYTGSTSTSVTLEGSAAAAA